MMQNNELMIDAIDRARVSLGYDGLIISKDRPHPSGLRFEDIRLLMDFAIAYTANPLEEKGEYGTPLDSLGAITNLALYGQYSTDLKKCLYDELATIRKALIELQSLKTVPTPKKSKFWKIIDYIPYIAVPLLIIMTLWEIFQ